MNGSEIRGPVVVGVTRSKANQWAVRWASDEAAWRRAPLVLLHAQEWPTGTSPRTEADHPAHRWAIGFRAAGEEMLETARVLATERHPGLEITTRLAEGRPVHALREAAEEAEQLVLGIRRLAEPHATLPIGSKGLALVGHLPCPLALVPEPQPDVSGSGPVVVGVDGSAASESAIGFAFEESALGKVELQAVEVQAPRDADWPDAIETGMLDLSEAMAGWQEKYPDIRIHHQVLTGDPAPLLAAVSRHARCLVVGSRGLGGFRGMVLGSTGRALVHRCTSPLVVVPNHRGTSG
jgi:nucleotide-binding universal stress UspA family protein